MGDTDKRNCGIGKEKEMLHVLIDIADTSSF